MPTPMIVPTIRAVAGPSPRVPRGSSSTAAGPVGVLAVVLMNASRVARWTAPPFQPRAHRRASSPVDESLPPGRHTTRSQRRPEDIGGVQALLAALEDEDDEAGDDEKG